MRARRKRRAFAFPCALVVFVGCGVADDLVTPLADTPAERPTSDWQKLEGDACAKRSMVATGNVLMRLADGHVHRLEAREGAAPEDLSTALDKLSPGGDDFVNASPDGAWYLVKTSRFGCGENKCLAVVTSSFCAAQVVLINGKPVQGASYAAVSSDGATVVFSAPGAHRIDLWVTRRDGQQWSEPSNMTSRSAHTYNAQPALAADGKHALFDCGATPTSTTETAICEVGLEDGTIVEVVAATDAGGGRSANHHAAYGRGGSIVFEGTWNGRAKQIWRVPQARGHAVLVNDDREEDGAPQKFTDEGSPCVLPDGRIVSLWRGRTDPAKIGSVRELKVMDADGRNPGMLLVGRDVLDLGLGCTR